MKINFINLTLCLFSFCGLNGQTNVAFLDFNNTNALVSNGGVLFTNNATFSSGYEVPNGSGIHAIYSAAFWFAGVDQNGTLRLSCPAYNQQTDIFSGPYSSTDAYLDPSYQMKYQSIIWSVTRNEIEGHIQNYLQPGYIVPTSIANWPGNGDVTLGVAENLAPFIDVDGDNIYNPTMGDHPDIRGDKAMYVIMNDDTSPHTTSGGESLGIEVHIMVYQYATNDYLNNTTFMNLRVLNRGSFFYQNFKIGMYMDADLGNYSDDYFGCLSSKNLIYTYNGDNYDENNGGASGYLDNPPCIGVTSLNNGISSAGFYTSSSTYPYTDPNNQMEFWNVMSANWLDGTPWTDNFQMDGNPFAGTGTTEVGLSTPSGDRRMIMNFDSVLFIPGQSRCEDFAILYSRQGNNLENVQGIIDLADSVKLFYDNQLEYNCNQVTASITENTADQFIIYPNPNTGNFTIKPNENMDAFELVISDPSGRILQRKKCEKNEIVNIELTDYTGICFVSIISQNSILTQKVNIN